MGKVFARVSFLPTLFFNIMMEKLSSRRWYDAIDQKVILGALPFTSMTQQLVEEENVAGVISLNETYELKWLSNMEEDWAKVGVKFLQLSTTDIFEVPSQSKLIEGVKFIKSFEDDDDKVYVHCKAGRTRSATLVACYLIEKYHWNPDEAVEYITMKRPHILLGPKQMEAINSFYTEVTQKFS